MSMFLNQYGWILASVVVVGMMYEVGIRIVNPDEEAGEEEKDEARWDS